jgi:hypothetical protein
VASFGNGIGQSCAFCGSLDVVWVHPLDEDLVAYREHGKGHTLPTSWALCDPCEGIYASGDDDAAVEMRRSSPGWSEVADDDVAESIRRALVVFRRADLGRQRFDPEPPSVTEARTQGFVPLRQLTGVAAELGPRWPAEHSLWLDDLGPLPGGDEHDEVPERWLVRSPWPSLSVSRTLGALWRWVESDDHPSPRPPVSEDPLVLEFFTCTEAEAVAFADLDQGT